MSIRWSSKLRYQQLVPRLRDLTFSRVLQDFFEVSMVGDLHVVEFYL